MIKATNFVCRYLKPQKSGVIIFIIEMKNLAGKTLIFYTFQQKKQLEYNVIAYQQNQQPILIKDVLEQLPLSLAEGRYHFRFKSEFFEGNEKISGWIDINNLAAKVPLVAGSIYVKILKVKSNAHNKMFNLEKLAKVGLAIRTSEKISQVKSPQTPKVNNPSQQQVKPVSPVPVPKQKQSKNIEQKPPQVKKEQIDLIDGVKRPSPTILQTKPQNQSATKPQQKAQTVGQRQEQDFFSFQKTTIFKNEQTIQEKLKFFKQTMNAEQRQKQNELVARDELEQKIKKWGYSGAKTVNNLTTLLSTLHDIWPEWPEISLTELLKPESLASHTKKALIRTHPDKNRTKPFKQKYLSKRVFELINDAKKASIS